MELNKYDLVDYLVSHFSGMPCEDCPIRKECEEHGKLVGIKGVSYICLKEDKAREALVKKYNL